MKSVDRTVAPAALAAASKFDVLLLAIASAWLFATRLTFETPDGAYFMPLIARGLGFGLAFVPLSLIALGTLSPRSVAQGAGLYNLFRQLGGSFGIALLTTLLDRRSKLHFANFAEHLARTDVGVQQRLAALQQGLVARGISLTGAKDGAVALLQGTVHRQAVVAGFIDVFWVLGVAASLGVLGVVLFQKPKNAVAPGAAH